MAQPLTVSAPTAAQTPGGHSAGRLRRWSVRLSGVYFVTVAGLCAVLWTASDRWWPATLILFGPRWLIVLPLAALMPLAWYVKSLRSGTALVAAALVAVGPLVGGRVSLPELSGPPEGALTLRVMTWNARGAAIPNPPLMAYVDRTRPDLVLIQEAGTVRPRDLPRGWQVAGGASGVVAVSRRPIREDGRLTEKHLGAPGACARYQIETPVGPIEVVNVHLPTPRPGIEAVLHSRLAGVQTLEEVTDARDGASRTARNWAGDPVDGLIVGGDFNTPSESVIFQRDWVGFTDAFASGGNGWGATKQTRWYGLRIDHRLFAPPWRCRDAQVGPAMGSDHRPVIADLVFDVE